MWPCWWHVSIFHCETDGTGGDSVLNVERRWVPDLLWCGPPYGAYRRSPIDKRQTPDMACQIFRHLWVDKQYILFNLKQPYPVPNGPLNFGRHGRRALPTFFPIILITVNSAVLKNGYGTPIYPNCVTPPLCLLVRPSTILHHTPDLTDLAPPPPAPLLPRCG